MPQLCSSKIYMLHILGSNIVVIHPMCFKYMPQARYNFLFGLQYECRTVVCFKYGCSAHESLVFN